LPAHNFVRITSEQSSDIIKISVVDFMVSISKQKQDKIFRVNTLVMRLLRMEKKAQDSDCFFATVWLKEMEAKSC